MVYSGLYPLDGDDYPTLRDALEKLQLNDAALVYEPESSGALGFGFRIGFLGLLHLEIVRERLEREFNLELISTAPNVVYRVEMEDGKEITVTNPSEYPEGKIDKVYEPVVRATVLSPSDYIGVIMELCQARRGQLIGMDYLSEDRVEIKYTLPMGEIMFDFFDALKSRTKGYASLDYEPTGEQASDLVKVDVLLQGEVVDAFSAIVHRDNAYAYGVSLASKLKELIPRQQFEVPIQAAIGARVIARENIRAIRKDVLAKCYGGDISPQAQAAREAEGGQEAHEDGGPRRSPPGSLHRRPLHRRRRQVAGRYARGHGVRRVGQRRPDRRRAVGAAQAHRDRQAPGRRGRCTSTTTASGTTRSPTCSTTAARSRRSMRTPVRISRCGRSVLGREIRRRAVR